VAEAEAEAMEGVVLTAPSMEKEGDEIEDWSDMEGGAGRVVCLPSCPQRKCECEQHVGGGGKKGAGEGKVVRTGSPRPVGTTAVTRCVHPQAPKVGGGRKGGGGGGVASVKRWENAEFGEGGGRGSADM